MNGPTVTTFAVPDVLLLTPVVHRDARGHFVERWREDSYAALGLEVDFVQDNLSRSGRGTVRGLHFQRDPHAQGKLVGVSRGCVLDVAVDLRRGSPAYGRHVAVLLDDVALQQLWVPRGFAHGFRVVSDVADVHYKVDAVHAPDAEGGVRWDDPALGIDWSGAGAHGGAQGLDLGLVAGSAPLVSARDAALPLLADAEFDFVYGTGVRT